MLDIVLLLTVFGVYKYTDPVMPRLRVSKMSILRVVLVSLMLIDFIHLYATEYVVKDAVFANIKVS